VKFTKRGTDRHTITVNSDRGKRTGLVAAPVMDSD